MATIIERQRADGSTAYLVQITVKRGGKIAHRESKTFDRRTAAAAWAKAREKQLAEPDGLTKASTGRKTLADAIDTYIAQSRKAIGRTKANVLASIKSYDIADMRCSDITSSDIIAFANELSSGRQPQTVGNYLSHLAAVFAIARPAWGMDLDERQMTDAKKVLKRLGATSPSSKRDRRPSLEELDTIIAHFEERETRRPENVPMSRLVLFALFSTRRQDEITRLRWEDFDAEHRRILVRDMKNPGEKVGNHVWCDLPQEAVDIIRAEKRTSDPCIFPYNAKSISAFFTRATLVLGIEDLHFHDLRHEGVTYLFEKGWTIPQVAAVSGHRSWSSLKRYSHLKMREKDKYADWPRRPR